MSGLGIYDELVKDIIDPKTGELFPALSCCNDENMAIRCKDDNAPKVIWSIKGNQTFNSQACIGLRNGFRNKKINLLVNEFLSENILKEKIKGNKTVENNL